MFVSLPSRRKPPVRWATPALLVLLSATFCWALTLGEAAKAHLLTQWGALTGGMVAPEVWLASLQRGTVLRLFTALFLHADWAHLLGNLVFLLIFGLPAEHLPQFLEWVTGIIKDANVTSLGQEPPQRVIEVRRADKLNLCPTCQRILYYPEEEDSADGA